MADWVRLNVGGTRFETKLATVSQIPSLARAAPRAGPSPPPSLARAGPSPPPSPCALCQGSDIMQNNVSCCSQPCPHRAAEEQLVGPEGEICVDCDPASFGVILNYLRHGTLVVPPPLAALVAQTAAGLGLPELAELALPAPAARASEWLKLNVGGQAFETTRATLTSHPDSSLARMFQRDAALPPAIMEDGVFQVDACPRAFGVVLNWLRYRRLMLGTARAEEVVPVADYFGLGDLNTALQAQIAKEEEKGSALLEAMEGGVERLEEALQEVRGELGNFVDKLDDIKMEVASVATNLEDLWRIKCEVSSVAAALGGGSK